MTAPRAVESLTYLRIAEPLSLARAPFPRLLAPFVLNIGTYCPGLGAVFL